MSHEITATDNLLLRREQAWHGLGRVIEDDLTAVQACEAAGLDWEVHGWEVWAKDPVTGQTFRVETHAANVRMIETPEGDIPSCLGVVGRGYQVCQNIELAQFVDALEQTGQVVTETCGSIRGGKNVWFLLRADSYSFGEDLSHSYILAANSHDGSRAIDLTPTDIRVVCKNTLQLVLPDLDDTTRFVSTAIRIRHSGQLSNKLDEARKALQSYGETTRRSRELFKALSDMPTTEDQAMAYFSGQYAAGFQAWEGTSEKYDLLRLKKQEKAAALFLNRFREESAKFGGASAWLAMNAWTGYVQNDMKQAGKTKAIRDDARIRSNLFGANSQRSQGALADAVATYLAA